MAKQLSSSGAWIALTKRTAAPLRLDCSALARARLARSAKSTPRPGR